MEVGPLFFTCDKIIGRVAHPIRNSIGVERGDVNENDSYFTLFLKFGVRLGAIDEGIYDRNPASHMKCHASF